ncbi:hypothetical protein [Saccharolobus shibatae]|uniref:Uncharacterized protein n=1 Tax=Saccharolobus shibatae TaxID=2286 RepID=A0A8F5H095_9CREN|nr:hypothetical protein [Saccharolobus shibatae]QXJ35956.1 hypothetical protein J5U22_02507 [Saccharolobus shibatae]
MKYIAEVLNAEYTYYDGISYHKTGEMKTNNAILFMCSELLENTFCDYIRYPVPEFHSR